MRRLLSYGALLARSAAIAGALRSRGLMPGDRVALVMRNVPDYVELLLAGWHAGLTMVPANAKLHRRELAYILGHAGARLCFVTPDLAETVAPLADELPLLERVIEIGDREHLALRKGEPIPLAEAAPGRRRLAVLHQRHDRTAQGSDADPSQSAGHEPRPISPMSTRSRRAMRSCMPRRCRMARGSTSCRTGCAAPARCCRPAAASIRPRCWLCCRPRAWPEGITLFAAPTMVRRLTDHADAVVSIPASKPSSMAAGRCIRLTSSGRMPSSVIAWRRSTARARARCASPRSTRPCMPIPDIRAIENGSLRSARRRRSSRSWSPMPTTGRCRRASPARCWCAARA